MADPEVCIRRAGTHDPEVMNTDWPQQHGRASFEALADDPDRVGLLRRGFGPHTVTLRTPL